MDPRPSKHTLQCLDAKMLQLGQESEQMRAFIAELPATNVIPAIEAALHNVSATTEQTHQKPGDLDEGGPAEDP